jgi:hypothetical protein
MKPEGFFSPLNLVCIMFVVMVCLVQSSRHAGNCSQGPVCDSFVSWLMPVAGSCEET